MRRSTGHVRAFGLAGRRDFLIRAGSLVPASAWFALGSRSRSVASGRGAPIPGPPGALREVQPVVFNDNRNHKGRCAGQGQHQAEKAGGADRALSGAFDDSTGPGKESGDSAQSVLPLFLAAIRLHDDSAGLERMRTYTFTCERGFQQAQAFDCRLGFVKLILQR
jgi:hypothetical protein